ncbi:peroxiredoxin family protein [Neobacillus niacini]|nr:peroxiredoxin family protein [Neobacillus niacini]
MHENIGKLEGMDIEMYILSKDLPEEQLQLYKELESIYGKSLPFVSDPDLKLIDFMDMKNGDVAYRGYAMLDQDGKVVFKSVNDHWGEQIDKTVEEIKNEYNKLK